MPPMYPGVYASHVPGVGISLRYPGWYPAQVYTFCQEMARLGGPERVFHSPVSLLEVEKPGLFLHPA